MHSECQYHIQTLQALVSQSKDIYPADPPGTSLNPDGTKKSATLNVSDEAQTINMKIDTWFTGIWFPMVVDAFSCGYDADALSVSSSKRKETGESFWPHSMLLNGR